LKEKNSQKPWLEWDRELRDREPAMLARARRELGDEIEFHAFEQFLFAWQWDELRAAAATRGVRLIGDLPIYPALDSADVWAHRELFRLGRSGRPKRVAGVPPDYFSETGQLWGNPLYDWKRLGAQGFSWWVERMGRQLELFDSVRLDHFRGFVGYWSVPARAATAVAGRWERGPGRALFDALAHALGPLPLIAEDLGEIDEPVHALRRELGLPGMRVLQFGFADADSLHAPHRHSPDTVVYTGTHDNDTSRGWLAAAPDAARHRALLYLGGDEAGFAWAMVRAALTSPAELAVVPLQDFLALGSAARLNTPGRETGNWTWRVRAEQIPAGLAERIRDLAGAAARRPPAPPPTPAEPDAH
jgi:4-alpha-glucanotransferase